MYLSRRGWILGATSLLAGCASGPYVPPPPQTGLRSTPLAAPPLSVAPRAEMQAASQGPVIDPHRIVRPDLLERARAALDVHGHRISQRDRLYIVDFQKFSGDERLYEVDLMGGWVSAYRTSHGRGSDPTHSGFAHVFSNEQDSHMSSLGSYVTAGPSWGPEQGPNVLLDGLEYSNNMARQRAIIIHGADYAEPSFLASQGKLGRSYGCFSCSHADLQLLRERMGEGRLLFAMN